MDNVDEIRHTSLDMLSPPVKVRAEAALAEANSMGYKIIPFETYRSPERQKKLFAQGRTVSGKIVTDAKAWQSFHQYGLALDIVFMIKNTPSWDKTLPWDKVAAIFYAHGFKDLKTERPHFEINGGMSWREAYNLLMIGGPKAINAKISDYCAHLA